MNRIRLLPENVANQIAAGEVVERPASVVKELVENAFDAEATRITVEIQAGGRSLIRVTDDGVGMSRDDALLCFERHATSKIRQADDLRSIATMGFRGEALPSIASVSRLCLISRERDPACESGTQVVIHGGRIVEVKTAGCAPGTSLEVRQLFFNLPARRKFLRSDQTERAHIQHYLILAALAYPEVAITFIQDGRPVWQLPAVAIDETPRFAGVKERLRGLYGAEQKLLPVDYTAPLRPSASDDAIPESETTEGREVLRVWGYIGAPGVSRGSREEQHLFVNRRPVENRGLNFALLEGYHTALMKGRYPVCCLFLEIDAGEVDVNIHPAKKEVKFHREYAVRQVVTQAVRAALLDFHEGPRLRSGPGPRTAPMPLPPRESPSAHPGDPPPIHPPALPPAASPISAIAPPVPPPSLPIQAVIPPVAPAGARKDLPVSGSAEPVPLLQVPLRILGVVGRLYVILESDRGVVLLDQHAAHERILYEQMLRRLEQGAAPSQRLLLPETIELSARDAEFLRQQLSALTRLGVSLSEFGERTFLLDGLPPFVRAGDARRFVLELIDELKSSGEAVNSWRLGELVVAKTVCRHAVKANDPLAGEELEKLLDELRSCQMPYTCPHGRPTLIEMNFRELDKKFGRVQ